MSLTFTVTVKDTVGGYGSYAQLIQTDLLYAGSVWASYINSNASIEVEVDIAPSAIHTADGTSATSVFLKTENGNNYFEFGTIAEMLTGMDPNGSAADVIIHVDPQYIDQSLYFDPNPSPTSSVPSNKVNAVEAFEHELGHAFGFNGFRDLSTGASKGSLSTFDVYVTTVNGIQYFTGPRAEAVYGGPVPLTKNNFYHVGNQTGQPGSDLLNDLMNGVIGFLGKGPSPSALDIAILQDSGVPILSLSINDVTISEGSSGTKLATFTVTRSGSGAFDVNFATADGSATVADGDYVATSGTLHFASGDTTKAISVAINGDTKLELDQTFFVNLSGASNGLTISDGLGIGTIVNDDTQFMPITAQIHAFAPGPDGWSSNDRFPRELADVNGDGNADIVGFGGAGVYVSLATGTGAFGAIALKSHDFGTEPSAGGWASDDRFPRQLADINGDHIADIVGFGGAGVYIALGTSSGSFGAAALASHDFGTEPGAGGWVNETKFPRELADINGDGKADIVGFGGNGVYVALANGNGSFGSIALASHDFGSEPAAGGWVNDDKFLRQLADVNGDGKADIVGFGGDGVYVALATGSGSFGAIKLASHDFGTAPAAGSWTSNERFPRELADVNGDGKADIIGFGGAGVYIAYGNGDGSFKPIVADALSFGYEASGGGWTGQDRFPRHLADVNHDGAADVIGFGYDGVYESLSSGFHLA